MADASPEAIIAGQEATAHLNNYLSQILIRRTQTDVMKDVLPPRREWVLFCGLSDSQKEEYAVQAGKLDLR